MNVCFIRSGRAGCGLSQVQAESCTSNPTEVTCPGCIEDAVSQGMEDALDKESTLTLGGKVYRLRPTDTIRVLLKPTAVASVSIQATFRKL